MSHRFKVSDVVRIDKAEGRNPTEILANLSGRSPLPAGLFEVVQADATRQTEATFSIGSRLRMQLSGIQVPARS